MDRQHVAQRDRVRVAMSQLEGDARRTFEAFKYVKLDFETFRNRLLSKYNDPATLGSLRSRLHGEKQKDDEPVAVFIQRKMGLHQRVEPYTPERQITCEVRELMRPEIRYATRTMEFRTLEELSRAAEWAEADFRGLQRQLRVTQPRPAAPPAPTGGPPSPCRTCQGWHFHRDCPHRQAREEERAAQQMEPQQSGNARRVDAGQGARPGRQ